MRHGGPSRTTRAEEEEEAVASQSKRWRKSQRKSRRKVWGGRGADIYACLTLNTKYQPIGMLNITQLAGHRQEEGRCGGRGGGFRQRGEGVEKSRVAGA